MNPRIPGAAALVITLACANAAAAQHATTGKRDFVSTEISGFNVVLVLGDTEKGRSSTEKLPEGAARALKDMGEFLPYKSYRVLDAQWTSCCSPKSLTTVSGRLQGISDFTNQNGEVVQILHHYVFSIAASASMTNIPVRFILGTEDSSRDRAGIDPASARERQDLKAEIETLEAQIRDMQRRVEVGTAPALEVRPLQDRHASLQRRLHDMTADAETTHGARPIIDSSFTMNAGETVVVGTSKLGGNNALIAVVTSVRKSAGPAR